MTPGQAAYEAHWKNLNGDVAPSGAWAAEPANVRQSWEVGAAAAIEFAADAMKAEAEKNQ